MTMYQGTSSTPGVQHYTFENGCLRKVGGFEKYQEKGVDRS